MARKRKGNPVHGWVVLDKPYGLGSTSAVACGDVGSSGDGDIADCTRRGDKDGSFYDGCQEGLSIHPNVR